MKKVIIIISFIVGGSVLNSCTEMLDPSPIDQLVNDIVLNEPKDIEAVEIGLYEAFRGTMPDVVVAGDLTADNLIHNGTFSQYRELGVKKITSANAAIASLWGHIYQTIYIANFMIEKIPEIQGVTASVRTRSMATAYFMRAMSNFYGVTTYGGIPKVTTTNIEDNRNIPRSTEDEIYDFIEEDLLRAAGNLGDDNVSNAAFVNNYTVKAALARFYLYRKNYTLAEQYASEVLANTNYVLESKYETVVKTDETSESIFEVGYTIADDKDPNNLNTLFLGRREIIPSNDEASALISAESFDRRLSIEFDPANQKGFDNGFAVAKYGTAVEDNNDIFVFRLAEMYLIRAEARTYLGNVIGLNSAAEDIQKLRTRAGGIDVGFPSQAQMILLIENERRYELSFEGHRWYDLRRTGRLSVVMPPFNANWRSAYELWPIPQREIQNNTALKDAQNPGY